MPIEAYIHSCAPQIIRYPLDIHPHGLDSLPHVSHPVRYEDTFAQLDVTFSWPIVRIFLHLYMTYISDYISPHLPAAYKLPRKLLRRSAKHKLNSKNID